MHWTSTQCVDAARGTLTPEEEAALDRHAGRCEACAETLRFWRHVADLAERERGYEPPYAAVEVVKGYVAGQPPARTNPLTWATDRLRAVAATLVFDSLQQALPAGVRTGVSFARQLLYDAPPLSVDLRLETAGRSQRILLAGQIVNAHRPSEGGQDARVAVGGPSEEVAAVMANQFGEFQCEFDRRDDLMLAISLKDGGAIVIPLDCLPISGPVDSGPVDRNGGYPQKVRR